MVDTMQPRGAGKKVGHQYPPLYVEEEEKDGVEMLYPAAKRGMGGVTGANTAKCPYGNTVLAAAVKTDSGMGEPRGEAPGLNLAYGNVGMGDANDMVRDRTPRPTLNRRKQKG